MMDNELRIQRLETEAADPEVALILLDVVLGHGSHPDPASELAPAIEVVLKTARKAKRRLDVIVTLSGTDEDPQGMEGQQEKLEAAGAVVFHSSDMAVRHAGRMASALAGQSRPERKLFQPVDLAGVKGEFAAINVGLESFKESLKIQEASVVQVDWKPAAGGNADLAALLEKMKG
jgi:FdrA protein